MPLLRQQYIAWWHGQQFEGQQYDQFVDASAAQAQGRGAGQSGAATSPGPDDPNHQER